MIRGPVFTIYPSFNEDLSVNINGIIKYACFLLDNGAEWLYFMPYNGRFNQLTEDEIYNVGVELIRLIGPLPDRHVIVSPPINYSTYSTIQLMRKWADAGIFCLSSLIGERIYSDSQIIDHYSRLGDEGIDIIAHEMPMIDGITGTLRLWPSDCLISVSKIPSIIGIKEDAKSVDYGRTLLQSNPDATLIFAGRKSFFAELLADGLTCYLNGISMINPRIAFKFAELCSNAIENSDPFTLADFIKEVDDPFWDVLVAKFGWHRINRASLSYFGLLDRLERGPMPMLSDEEYNFLSKFWIKHSEVINDWI